MPLGVLSESDAKNELARFGIITYSNEIKEEQDARSEESNIVSFSDIKRGRGNKEEVPESVRAFVASEAICGADPEVLSKEFNVSRSSISAYKQGAHSTASYNNPNADLLAKNQSAIDRIIGPAQSKILKAINSITDEKLDGSKARDAAAIASSLSSVVKNLQPEEKADNRTQINVFVPRKNEEEDYEIVHVD